MQLATVDNAALAAELHAQVRVGMVVNQNYWLGGSDAAAEGAWSWVDGTAWAYSRWSAKFRAPRNDTARACLGVLPENEWVDFTCDVKQHFVCAALREWPECFLLLLSGCAACAMVARVRALPPPACLVVMNRIQRLVLRSMMILSERLWLVLFQCTAQDNHY